MRARSRLEAEIREQPTVLVTQARSRTDATAAAGRMLRSTGVTHLVVTARGSSANAARYARYLYGRELGISVYLAAPSLYAESDGPSLDGAVVMGISQSGQSPDVVAVLEAAHRQGRPSIAVTNDVDSPLATHADLVVPLNAGPELSVAATKSYTATVQAIIQIAIEAGADGLRAGLDRLPGLLDDTITTALDEAGVLTAIAHRLAGLGDPGHDPRSLTVVGRGTGSASAAEMALKIREVGLLRTEAYSAPDLLHGPVAAIGPTSSVWLVASPSYPLSYWEALATRLRAAGSDTYALTSTALLDTSPEFLALPGGLPAWLFDVLVVAYGQCAALRVGELRGLDVDRPRGLAKVTLTR